MIGILHRLPYGSGGWKLVCKDGEEYELLGEIPVELEGKTVQVKGKKVTAYGFFMSGLPQIEVEKITNVTQK